MEAHGYSRGQNLTSRERVDRIGVPLTRLENEAACQYIV
jgi:hypothetical protein